jgi:hypothetical protein
MLKSKKDLVVRDWKQDLVYLIQFPRCRVVVTPSPWALKLETWLRFTKLNYTNVSNELKFGSAKGQIPFIELNGRQIADSSFIIENLKSTFDVNIDRNLSEQETAIERAFYVLVEESLLRTVMYYRSKNFRWLATEDGFLPHFTGIKKFILKKFLIKKLESMVRK